MSKKQRSSTRRAPARSTPRAVSSRSPVVVAPRRPGPGPRRSQTWILVGGAAVILVASIAAVVLVQGAGRPTGPAAFRSPTATTTTTAAGSVAAVATSSVGQAVSPAASGFPTIDGIACDPSEQITYHVHAHLNIRVAGQLETIPNDVGRRTTCLYWLHTHQPLGVIHVEAPRPTTFTLGQFFDVWGKPLDATHVGDWAVPPGSRIWVFVDRKPVQVDPRSVQLTNLEAIELQVGPAALEPLPYTFPADFG